MQLVATATYLKRWAAQMRFGLARFGSHRLQCAFFLFAFVSLCSRATASGADFLLRDFELAGQVFRYQVYRPSSNPHGTGIILYLHGAGGIGTDGVKQVHGGLAEELRAHPDKFPYVIVFPQASERWVTADMERVAMTALDRSIREFHTDDSRQYLIGYSVGAAAAWRLAFEYPARFAAVVPIAGYVESPTKLFTPEESASDLKTHGYLHQPDVFAALAERVRSMNILIYHGTNDDIVPILQSRSEFAALQATGSHARFVELPSVDHQGIVKLALSDQALWEWLGAQRQSSAVSR